jgi:hypothetical protein
MDFNSTIDLIIKELEEAGGIIDDLKRYPGVPVLQVEMARLKCKSAGEVIAMLKTLKDNSPYSEEMHIIPAKPLIKPPEEEIKRAVTATESKVPDEVYKKDPVQAEPVPGVGLSAADTGKMQKKDSGSLIVADKFSHLADRFNEQLGSLKNEEDISDIINTKPLTNLSEAIGINDKFLFIREIFNDNQTDYNQAITRLDNSKSIDDAKAVIMSYAGDNNENEAVRQLIALVKRKFPAHE